MSRRRSPAPNRSPSDAPEPRSFWTGPLPPTLLVLFVVGFCFYFLTQRLPNNSAGLDRLQFLFLIPDAILGTIEANLSGRDSGIGYLSQRFDLLAFGGLILLAAAALGRSVLRAIGLFEPLTRPERLTLGSGLGLSLWSLMTLGLGRFGVLDRSVFLTAIVFAIGVEAVLSWRSHRSRDRSLAVAAPVRTRTWLWLSLTVPFVIAMLLGAMLPSIDFDVKAYHFTGPKEFFQQGEIGLLRHNVYTSFPFLTEMLVLLGMVLEDDWFRGALVGKTVLMSFAPLTALAIYAAVARVFAVSSTPGESATTPFGRRAGLVAAVFYLTTPWTYRISIIAYTEGALSAYVAFGLLAVLVTRAVTPSDRWRGVFLTGLLTGSAMACKYPGLISAVIPLGLALAALVWGEREGRAIRFAKSAGIYVLGVTLTIGPWLLKNAIETDNPVYPLAYTVFGDDGYWSPELNEKWKAGHSPDGHTFGMFVNGLLDVTVRSDWQSPLLFAFAPLCGLLWLPLPIGHAPVPSQQPVPSRRAIGGVLLFAIWLWLTWWVLTHRIDRFWVPMQPVIAFLAGIGFTAATDREAWPPWIGRVFRTVVVFAVLFNLAYVLTPYSGYNGYLVDLEKATEQVQSTAPLVQELNRVIPTAGEIHPKVLLIGEAQVFDARFPLRYNTVFNRSLFQMWGGEWEENSFPSDDAPLDAECLVGYLVQQNITHVAVNWQEILRYRTTYGFTDFVTPDKFRTLVDQEILDPPRSFGEVNWESLSDSERAEIERWAPSLKTEDGTIFLYQIFRVSDDVPVRGIGCSFLPEGEDE